MQNRPIAVSASIIAAVCINWPEKTNGARTKVFFTHCRGRMMDTRPIKTDLFPCVNGVGFGIKISRRIFQIMSRFAQAIRYTNFAIIATIANIGGQDVFWRVFVDRLPLFFSILFGTLVGLGTKYFLDKKYIFHQPGGQETNDVVQFLRYTCTGFLTTLLFWLSEYAFHFYFGTPLMRYAGALIGLAMGYYLKYHLDKRYVFTRDVPG